MALNKRQYTDGTTIITAANLNEIQDCIIALEGNYVPKTRTVAGKALSSNITLAASDVGAVPTSRTVNGKALSSNITLAASDVGAAPTGHASTGTTYGKGTSSNYGHVKLTDSLANTTTAATGGLALSAKAGNDAQKQISAYVETGNTASRAYTKGDHVIWKGVYYVVSANIASGGTFTSGTNLTSTTVGKEITDILSTTINTSVAPTSKHTNVMLNNCKDRKMPQLKRLSTSRNITPMPTYRFLGKHDFENIGSGNRDGELKLAYYDKTTISPELWNKARSSYYSKRLDCPVKHE